MSLRGHAGIYGGRQSLTYHGLKLYRAYRSSLYLKAQNPGLNSVPKSGARVSVAQKDYQQRPMAKEKHRTKIMLAATGHQPLPGINNAPQVDIRVRSKGASWKRASVMSVSSSAPRGRNVHKKDPSPGPHCYPEPFPAGHLGARYPGQSCAYCSSGGLGQARCPICVGQIVPWPQR